MATYAETIERLGKAVTDNTPANYKINLAVYTKIREVIDYYLWLKESPSHDEIQIAIRKSVDEACGFLRVETDHFDMWTDIFHTRFAEEMAKVNVYEIYAIDGKVCVDMSFHNLYVPI